MKKLTTIAICGLLLVASGCGPDISYETTKLKKGEWDSVADEFTHKGHDYIRFGFGDRASIVHDPDCPCTKPTPTKDGEGL